jgi:hypothetical protein
MEELGRKKPKTISKLMEIANSWVDGEDHVRKPWSRSNDEDDDHKHDAGHQRDRRKKRRDCGYEDTNIVSTGYSDRRDDRYDDQRGASVTIVAMETAVVPEEIVATTGNDLLGSRSCLLLSS